MSFTTASPLPSGTVGVGYSQTIAVTGGTAPYIWSITAGSLPSGLALSSTTGAIGGTPTSAGSFTFTVQVTDSAAATASQAYTLAVGSPGSPLSIVNASPLPNGTAGATYSLVFAATGGTLPYSWSVSNGALPSGITLNSATGAISGTPKSAGTFTVTIRLTDSAGAMASQVYTLTVISPGPTLPGSPLTISTASPLPGGTVGVGYSQTIAVTGGTAPYVWSITAGALPSGLALSSATGAIGGTPTSAGSFTFTVQVTDSAAATASQAYTLAVSSPGSPLSIVTASPLPSGTAGATYSQWLAAAGGKLPYSWSVSNGALPSGLTLNSATGAISGTPKSAGTFTFTIRVTDSAGAMASQVYTLTVISPGSPLTIATASPLSSGTVGVGYSQTIAVTGGTAPYVWSITAGALPSGLALSSATGAIGGTPSSAGSFALTVRVTDSAAATASQAYTLTVSTAGLSLTGSIAQVASGGGWDTTLTLVNTGASAGEALLNFLGNDGNPLQLPFVISQIPLPAASLVASTLDQPLNANSMLVLDSQQLSNRGPQVGSARLLTNGKVGGFAIFRYSPTGQEAVVPLETRDAPSYVLAFDNTGVLATGVALANVATQPANIPVVIRDDTGRQIGTDAINLAGQGHTSFMLTDHYGITKGKRGSVEFLSGHITALGLRANGSALTTLPVLANVTAGGGSMAQVASGGGWQTTFTLVNTGTSAAQAQLSFFDNNGKALSLPVTLVQSGNVITATTITQQIAAGAALVVLSQGSNTGPAVVGSAQLTTDGNVGGFAIFRYNPTGQEAVVPLEVRNASGYVLAFDNTNGLATGIALSNITNRAVSVPVVLNDDTGTTLVTTTINLAALGHTSFMLQDSYASVAGKRGTVEFDNPVGAQISVLGLRATPTGAVTTIPVLAK